MENSGANRPKPNPWPAILGCGGIVFMLCVAAIIVAWIIYG